jgi:hypothetical protein
MAAALAGCGSGDVWVGQLQEGLDLAQCAGTTCSGVVPRELQMPAPRSCEGALGAELIEEFSVQIPEQHCSDRRYCQYSLSDFDVAPDGSSWVLGRTELIGNEPSELWITRFSDEGAVLSSHKVATGMSFNGGSVSQLAEVAVDARGHAFVLIYQLDPGPNADAEWAEQTWLTELDTEGEEVNGPIPLAGIAAGKLAVRDDGSVVLAANALLDEPYSVVAALTDTGERLWSRADLSTAGYGPEGAILGLSTSGTGDALVLARRHRYSGNDYAYGLTRFDDAGNVAWDVVFDRHFDRVTLAAGNEDGAFIVSQNLIGYVRGDGTAAWTYELPRHIASAAFDADRKRVYAVSHVDGGTDSDEPFATTELFAIPEDGESCERYTLPQGAPTGAIDVDAEGRLYVAGHAEAPNGQPYQDQVLMRLRLPDE